MRRVGSVDPRQVVDEHDDGVCSAAWTSRSRVARAMANGSAGSSPVSMASAARTAAARAGARSVDAVEQPVEQRGQPRPGHLDLGLDPASRMMRTCGSSAPISSAAFVEHRGLADPGLADDGEAPPWPLRRARRGRRSRRPPGGRQR